MEGQTIELNTGDTEAPVEAQAEETVVEAETTGEEQSVEALPDWAQAKLKKLEEERENYKKGMLKAKRTLESREEPETEATVEATQEEEKAPEWDDLSKTFQKQTLSQAQKIAKESAKEVVEKANEEQAIQEFLSTHPELDDNALWKDVVSNYHPKHGKQTVKSILKDLERAHVLASFDKGGIEKIQETFFKQGERKGAAEKTLADMATVTSGPTGRSSKSTGAVTPGAIKMAERMRIDPKKLSKEDDSATAEIKI